VETSESIHVEKPDPRVFRHMLAYFQAGPREIVYVGDDPVRDVEAAKRVGLRAIHLKLDPASFSESWRDYNAVSAFMPDATIEQFTQLPDIIR
jgi:FMN phosphatase YigB (HAD superfamily)